jgi:hypothetical protein
VLGRSKVSQVAQKRLFLANPFNIFGLLNQPAGNGIFTSTFWATLSSTITMTSMQLCIPVADFASVVDGGNTKYSTSVCARRRREVALVEDILESIRPSEIKQ